MKNIIFFFAGVILFASCMNSNDHLVKQNELIAKNKARMEAFYEQVLNAHNPAMIDSFCSADYVEHTPDPGSPADREGLKQSFTDFFEAFPDAKTKINFMIADTSTVVVHYTFTGTNTGAMMEMPATNKTVTMDGTEVIKIKDGFFTDHWAYGEQIKMMTQLGLMPEMNAPTDIKTDGKIKIVTKKK